MLKQIDENNGEGTEFSIVEQQIPLESLNLSDDEKNSLLADETRWNALIDDYRQKSRNNQWGDKAKGDTYHFMDMPKILKAIGANSQELEIFGSFFVHANNPEHIGINHRILRQLPRAITRPLMIFEGNLTPKDIKKGIKNRPQGSDPSKVIMLLRLKDANGVPVVVPVMFNKQHGKAIIDVMLSAYGRKVWSNPKAFDYGWLDDNLTEQKMLYADKEKSTEWLRSIRKQYPTGMVAFSHALSGNIIATFDDVVKTENKSSTELNDTPFLEGRSRERVADDLSDLTIDELRALVE